MTEKHSLGKKGVLLLLTLLISVFAGCFAASAASEGRYVLNIYRPKEALTVSFWPGAVVENLTVSKPALLSVTPGTKDGRTALSFTGKRRGTATVRFTLRTGSSSSNMVYRVSVIKWRNPVKTLKIGKKNLSNRFKGTYHTAINPVSGKLNIQLRAGFKRVRVTYIPAGSQTEQRISPKARVDLKSGDRLRIYFNNNLDRVKADLVEVRVR